LNTLFNFNNESPLAFIPNWILLKFDGPLG